MTAFSEYLMKAGLQLLLSMKVCVKRIGAYHPNRKNGRKNSRVLVHVILSLLAFSLILR